MESKDEFKESDIKKNTCYYFDDTMWAWDRDIDSSYWYWYWYIDIEVLIEIF